MGIALNQMHAGMGLIIEGEIYIIMQHQFIKPGKGSAFAKVRLKNAKNQLVHERNLKEVDKFDEAILEERRLQFQYKSGDNLVFMDQESYEQIEINQSVLGDDIRFLQENLIVTGLYYEHHLLKVNLPNFITSEITHTEPGIKGDSSRSGTKPATIDTGATIQVPLFINLGDKIKIDTRDGAYIERV